MRLLESGVAFVAVVTLAAADHRGNGVAFGLAFAATTIVIGIPLGLRRLQRRRAHPPTRPVGSWQGDPRYWDHR